MEEEESDDDFDCEQFLLAEQVRKFYYHGLYPFGIFVIWTLLRADCYDLSDCDSLGNPPIVYASKCGSTVLLRLLLYYNADINALSKLRETALIVACRNKRMKAIKFLLKRGAQIDRAGYSALRWAVLHERVDMVRLLLLYNTSVIKDCYTAGSALDIARQGTSEQHAIILKELEKNLVTEREILLVEIAESKKDDAIAEIDNYRIKREAKKETKVLDRNQATNATKRTRKLQVKQKIDPPRTRRPSHETSVGTRVPTPPIEEVAWKSLETTDSSTSSNWLKVGKGQWKTQSYSTGTILPSQDTTVVEAFAPDNETVHKLLTSNSKWKSFLHQQMPHRVSQDQLTVEDLD